MNVALVDPQDGRCLDRRGQDRTRQARDRLRPSMLPLEIESACISHFENRLTFSIRCLHICAPGGSHQAHYDLSIQPHASFTSAKAPLASLVICSGHKTSIRRARRRNDLESHSNTSCNLHPASFCRQQPMTYGAVISSMKAKHVAKPARTQQRRRAST